MASSALQDLPGYDLYAAAQMPFGAHSADFACAQSYTSKLICELPGNLTVSFCTSLTHVGLHVVCRLLMCKISHHQAHL